MRRARRLLIVTVTEGRMEALSRTMQSLNPFQASGGATRRIARLTVIFVIVCLGQGLLRPPAPAHALDPKKALTQYIHDIWQIEDGLPQNSITAIVQTRDGYLWLGTQEGLARFDGVRFTVFDKRDTAVTIQNNYISVLCEDRAGSLWIGTFGGLNRLKDGKFTTYTTKDGLFNDMIYRILEDGKGDLWMSCNQGIFRVSKKELNEFAEGHRRTITSIAYGTADGMKSRECNGGQQPAGWKTRDGRLWFPTIKGVVMIDPDHLPVNTFPPPVVIEHVVVDNAAIALGKHVELSPGTEKLELHYTGLSFLAPEKVQFKYRLEGFDQDWVDAGIRRVAYYTNLPPGTYRFRVIACNNDGVWNETGASLELYLRPHFYQTAWFYVLCALAAVLTGAGGHRLRIRQLKARERELVGLVAARTKDLSEAMTTIEADKAIIESDNARKTNELEDARALQFSMLPQQLPTVAHLDLAVSMQTATEVGGDYYDVHLSEDSTLTLALGDATGHGLKAGILVATAKSYFQTLAGQGTPVALLEQMATGLKNMHLPRLYMGLTVLQCHDHTMQLVGAGMPPVFLYRHATHTVETHALKGMPLGSPLETPYQPVSVDVQAGDTILLLSDGLPELFNPAKQIFGDERIQQHFGAVAAQPAAEILEHLKHAAAEWAAGRPYEDDITLFVVKVTGW